MASRGQSEAAFEQTLRNDLRKQALVQAVVDSAIVPKQVTDNIERILLQQREVRQLRFPADQFASKVTVTDAQIAEYYQGNRGSSRHPKACVSNIWCCHPRRLPARSPFLRRALLISTTRTRRATAPRNNAVRATS